ncbi:EBP1 Probable NADPH dehydrogenase [Candida maltosa Xu316]
MTITSQPVEISPLGNTKVFEPIKVGANTLNQRIAYVPTTRFRATKDHIPSDLQLEYYKARAQAPGTLLITEATYTSPQGGIDLHVPGIYNSRQAKAWKQITDAIHEQKSFAAVQLWYLGRVANAKDLKDEGLPLVGPSEYPNAAKKALEAGFDYLEVHSAHGYLIDQFLNPASNKRTDEYGGSIENRARLLFRVLDKLIELVGADKVAVRFSPWATFQGVEPEGEKLHTYILQELTKRAQDGKELAYISYVEPRVSGIVDVAQGEEPGTNDFVLKAWKGRLIRAGNYTYDAPKFETIVRDVQDDRTIIGFSRFFTSNPDLVEKLKDGTPLNYYNRDEFYKYYNYGYNTYDDSAKEVTGKPLA